MIGSYQLLNEYRSNQLLQPSIKLINYRLWRSHEIFPFPLQSYFPEEFYGDFDLHNQVNDDLQNYSDDIEANKNVLKRNKCHRDYR